MTGAEWAASMRARLMQRIAERRVIFLAATGTMDEVAERVWGRGGLTDGGAITYKEDYEVWAYKPPSPRKPSGKGKPNKQGKTRKIKGGYYPTYLAYKDAMGRKETPFELTGSMRQDWLGGASPTPVEVSPLETIITMTEANARKAEGLAKQKGEFLQLSAAEVKSYGDRAREIWAEP